MIWIKITSAGIGLLFMTTTFAYAQPEMGGINPNKRQESVAVRQAIVNSIMSVGVGLGAVALFDDPTLQTVGATMAAYGLVVGPSTGNFYANDYLRGGLGALTRFGAALLLRDASREVFGSEFAGALDVDTEDRKVSLRDTEIIVGGILMAGAAAFNVISAPASVREYNRKLGYALGMQSLPGTGRTAPVFTAKLRL